MEALWTLAGNGRTVVLTIHQPRSSIYKMFDQVGAGRLQRCSK